MLDGWVGSKPGKTSTGSSSSQDFFRSLLDSIGDDVLVVDPEFRVCFTNCILTDKLRLSPGELRQATCFSALCQQSAPCLDADCLVRSVLETGQSCTKNYSLTFENSPSEHTEARGYPITDESGKITHIVITRRDATESMLLQQRLMQLNDTEKRKAQGASALVRVARAVGATLDVASILDIIGEQASDLLQADRCAVLLLDEQGTTLSPSYAAVRGVSTASGKRAGKIPVVVDRIWRFVLDQRKIFALDRVVTQRKTADNQDVQAKSVLVAPLVAKDRPLGVLYVDVTSRDHVWTEEDKMLAGALADQAALAIDNAKAYSTIKEKVAQVQVINEVAQAVSSSLNLNEIVERMSYHVGKAVAFDRASVFLIGENKDDFRAFRVADSATSRLAQGAEWLGKDSTAAWVVKNGKAWIDEDIAECANFPDDKILLDEGVRSKIVVPLISNNIVIGTLNLGSNIPAAYSEKDLEVLLPIAAQIAPAVENARLFETAKHHNRELAALHSVATAVSKSLEIGDMANSCLDAIAGIFDCEGLGLVVWEERNEDPSLHIFRGLCEELSALLIVFEKSPIAQRVVREGECLIIPDASEYPTFSSFGDQLRSKSLISFPVKHKDEVLGFLCLLGPSQRRFDEDDLRLLDAMCSQVGIGIERTRLHGQVNKQASEFRALFELGKDISGSLNLSLILESVVKHARLLIGSDISFLCLVSPSRDEMKLATQVGITTERMRRLTVKINEYKPALNVPFVVDDIGCADSIEQELSQVLVEEGLASMLTVPLLMNNELLGVLHVANREKIKFSDDDVTLLAAFANQAAIAIRNAQLHEEVKQLAVTDGLTALHNHRYFYQRLSEEFDRAMRFGRPLSLIFIDLDDLKIINDTYGHLQGDSVLRDLARLIESTVRSTDIVSRYGGDELTIILPETAKDEAVIIGNRLQKRVEAHDFLSSSDLKVTISLGIAYLSSDVRKAVDLVRCADKAAYQAKMLGKSRICVFGDVD